MQRIEGNKKTMIFPTEQDAKIKKVAKRHGITEAEAIRKMVGLGLDVYETYAMFGVPQLAELSKKVTKTLVERRQPKLV